MTDTVIVAIGDSTTAGTPGFQSPIEAPPDGRGNRESQFSFWLMHSRLGWRVLNRGVNGERTAQIRARFRRDVLSEHPALVIIIGGVNDIYAGFDVDTVCRELEAMYDLARHASAPIPVVAGSILPYNTATAEQNARMHAVNAWIREYSAAHPGVSFCDTRAAVAAPGAGDRLLSSPDDLHPSAEGYRLMALALEPVIHETLSGEQPLR
jgi:lysophospholipase L1-like esterase